MKVTVNIGDVNELEEAVITVLFSDLGTIVLSYYPSDIPYTDAIEKWMDIFVNHMETLPPTKVGLFVEALR